MLALKHEPEVLLGILKMKQTSASISEARLSVMGHLRATYKFRFSELQNEERFLWQIAVIDGLGSCLRYQRKQEPIY